MNIPTNEELYNYRVVVGNNTPTTHPVLGTIPVKGCFPLPLTMTGTITTENTGGGLTLGLVVFGVSTLFLTGGVTAKVEVGDFLANSNGVIRRITSIESNTVLHINAKFPSSLSGAAVKLVRKNSFRWILASSTGTAAATLNEQGFAVNDKWFDDGAPVSYDVSTASSEISFTLSY